MIKERIQKISKKLFVKTNTTSLLYRGIFLSIYSLLMVLAIQDVSFAGSALFQRANQMISDVRGELLAMSAAAAGVGVGTGVFMKKLSMGKQDRIETGNKVIRDSLIGFGTINAVPIILDFIGKYTG